MEVMSGRYYDHLKIDKKIVLLGVDSGGEKPVLDATGYASPITVTADGVVVEGLRLMNGGPGSAGILVLSSGNVIRNNDASNNYVGVRLVGSNNSKVQGNVASGNLEYGIVLEGSFGNVISDNVMMKNFIGNAFDDGTNRWDDGSVGNRYGDFDDPVEGCIDADGDGICDRDREIPGGSNLDRFPRSAG
jgi:parallel beta-helix repeat protein